MREPPDGFQVSPLTPDVDWSAPYRVVSFFTERYADLAPLWLQGLKANGHHHQAVVLDAGPRTNWRSCTMLKPTVILWALEQGPTAWIDVDAICRQHLHVFDQIAGSDWDLAIRLRKETRGWSCWASGTLFFNPTETGLKLCRQWKQAADEVIAGKGPFQDVAGDQDVLGFLGCEMEGLRIYDLPPEYTYIFDRDRSLLNTQPVVEHFQQSRQRADFRMGHRTCQEFPS